MAVSVKIGADASHINVSSDTELSCTLPAGTAGVVDVVVTTAGGQGKLAGGFTYVKAPTITGVDTKVGPLAGGTKVKVTGSGYVTGVEVSLGGKPVTGLTIKSPTQLELTTPAGAQAGPVDLVVQGVGGSATAKAAFVYAPKPTVSKVNPPKGPEVGGITVTITGTGFKEGKPAGYLDELMFVVYDGPEGPGSEAADER